MFLQRDSSCPISCSNKWTYSVQHEIFAINNSNGVIINSIQTSSGGLVTCFLSAPFGGFPDPQPFENGDEIYVEYTKNW